MLGGLYGIREQVDDCLLSLHCRVVLYEALVLTNSWTTCVENLSCQVLLQCSRGFSYSYNIPKPHVICLL